MALLVVFGVFRISPIDVPEHIAIGRHIWDTGAPLLTNTFSWTFPDHPNDQQYTFYQLAVYVLSETLGFWTLSVFCCVSWLCAVGAWGGWAGGPDRLAKTSFVWFLAVLGVQRHLVPRPEVFTVLGLGLLLVAFERWRARPETRAPLIAMVLTLWFMVNTHQMYLIGVVLIAGFAVHIAVTRALRGRGWLDESDADLPLTPLLATFGASVAVMAISPLGPRAWIAPWALVSTVLTLGSDGTTGARSAELEPIWTDPLGGPIVAVFAVVVGVAAVRARGRWSVIELGVLAMGTALVVAALRGIPFFALAAASVVTRWDEKAKTPLLESVPLFRAALAACVVFLAGLILGGQVKPRDHAYLRRQQGLGKSVGEWAESATAFLREHPPPGQMLNLGWGAGNYLTYDVHPVKDVFVDGRWEAYPKDFLLQSIEAQSDQAVLDELIETWMPGFVVGEMRLPDHHERIETLLERGWALVYLDSIVMVVVPPLPATAEYRARFATSVADVDLADWLPEHPILHAQQQIRFAGFLATCGEQARAEALFEAASAYEDHPEVAASLKRFQ
ncbi:MAG: hypothetical protein AAGA48_09705 [Myxococcota bacterium]